MAPKRKPIDSSSSAPVAAATTTRVTRSSARQAKPTAAPPAAEPKPPRNKKAKTKAPAAAAEEEGVTESETLESSKTIIIEHCRQCKSFKTRAVEVKIGLEKGVDGVNVLVNPEKPRKGCFEIREKGGGIFVSLLDMKRPFNPMRALDMENVISEIVEKIR